MFTLQSVIEKGAAKQPNYSFITAILCWSGLVVMSSLYVTIPLLSVIASDFRISQAQAAGTGSIFSLGFAAGCLIYGPLSDKYGRKKIIVIGLLCLVLISLSLGLVHSLPALLLLRGLQGAAAATFSPVALSYTVEVFPAERRVTAIGFISTGFLAAGIAGQVISSLMSQSYGWNTVFYLLAGVYAVTAILVLLFLPQGKPAQRHINIWEPFKQIGVVFTRRPIVFCYVIALVLLLSFVSMYTVLGSYLSDRFGLSKQDILYVRSAGILSMLLSPFAGRLAQRFGLLILLRAGLLLSIAGLLSLGLISSLPLLIVMSLLFVAGIALTVPSLISMVGQLAGPARGTAVSVYTFILFAGTSLGPILSLWFMQSSSYSVTFALLGLVLGCGLLAASLIRDTQRETADPS